MLMPLSINLMNALTVIVLRLSFDSSVMCDDNSQPNQYDQFHQLSPRQVNTKYGALRGTMVTFTAVSAPSLPTIEAYLGVPYATPPIGSLRFMPPVTPTHWRGVRLANKLSPVCPQRLQFISRWDNTTEALKRVSPARLDYLKKLMPLLKNQSEDCLYLNIWTPVVGQQNSQTPKIKVPVIVFLHGESYDWNSGNVYDGSVLSSFGHVVVVTLNYRLGVFGFLPAIVDGSVRGNYGLMDQVAALHWIQENIGEFGGYADNITLIGYGHGAACAHLLMISPMAKGLFKRIILMSGSALSPWAIAKDTDLFAKNLGLELNCPIHDGMECALFVNSKFSIDECYYSNSYFQELCMQLPFADDDDSGAIVDCLRRRKVDEILDVLIKTPDYLSSFGPIIDSIVVPSHPKSDTRFNNYYNKSNHHNNTYNKSGSLSLRNYDLIFGINRHESPCIFPSNEEEKGIDTDRRDRVLRTLVRNLFDFHQQAIFLTLINEYTDWSRPAEHPMSMLESLKDILGDALVVAPLMQTGDFHSKTHHDPAGTNPKPTQSSTDARRGRSFFYVFAHQSEDLITGHQYQYHHLNSRAECTNTEELSYLFGVPLASAHFKKHQSMSHLMSANGNYSKQEMSLSETVMTYWVSFAKWGDPSVWPQDISSLSRVSSPMSLTSNSKGRYDTPVWPSYDPIQRKYLMIGIKSKVRDHYHSHRLSFWLNLIPRLHHPGEEQVYLRHHLLTDHDNPSTYDGIVRQLSFKFLSPLPTVKSFSDRKKNHVDPNDILSTTQSISMSVNTELTTEGVSPPSVGNNPSAFPARTLNSTSLSVVPEYNYLTALTATIAIGVTLLILNMIIFAGVYYQLDKNNKTARNTNGSAANDQMHSDKHRSTEGPPSPSEGIMIDNINTLADTNFHNTIIRPSQSPIGLNENIYYQYKQKSSYSCNSNNVPLSNTNSLRRGYKVSIPTVPDGIGYHNPQMVNKVGTAPGIDHSQEVPFTASAGFTSIGTSTNIQHNCIAKEMAV